MALTLAGGVAGGDVAAGISCVKGRALIFDAENGRKPMIRRFRAARVGDLDVQLVDAGGLRIITEIGWFKQTIEEHKAKARALQVRPSVGPAPHRSQNPTARGSAPCVTAHVPRAVPRRCRWAGTR